MMIVMVVVARCVWHRSIDTARTLGSGTWIVLHSVAPPPLAPNDLLDWEKV